MKNRLSPKIENLFSKGAGFDYRKELFSWAVYIYI